MKYWIKIRQVLGGLWTRIDVVKEVHASFATTRRVCKGGFTLKVSPPLNIIYKGFTPKSVLPLNVHLSYCAKSFSSSRLFYYKKLFI